MLASNTAMRDLQLQNASTGLVAADPIGGAAQNLVGRGRSSPCWICWVGELGLLTMDGEGQSALFDDVHIPMWPNRSTGRNTSQPTVRLGVPPEQLRGRERGDPGGAALVEVLSSCRREARQWPETR